MADYDLCIIGGGVNGCGIARDAAGRGLSVLLVEAGDLASATSSASTKLIHGGLRYLEHHEFNLVRQSLKEREILLRSAPHIIWPMDFILPYDKKMRPLWLIRLGLFIYDHLGGRKKLKNSGSVDFSVHPLGDVVSSEYRIGLTYQDCWVEDSRLVVLNAVAAKERGADILTYSAVTSLVPSATGKSWRVHIQKSNREHIDIEARCVVNAGGPWVRSILDHAGISSGAPSVRLSKGSHIIVPKLHDRSEAFILQQPDGRIVFAIPYEHHYTFVGTTDVPYDSDPASPTLSPAEAEYLIGAVNNAFSRRLTTRDIVWSYAGVRPLLDDGKENISEVTRDYKLHLDTSHGAPILSVFGGKITTYRKLSEQVVNMIAPKTKPWTGRKILPGGDMKKSDFSAFYQKQIQAYPGFSPSLIYRYARAYGTRMDKFMKEAKSEKDLGRFYGDQVYEAELVYLIVHEFARTVDDVLWRRSKLGLHISRETLDVLTREFPILKDEVLRHVQKYI
ncbi:MAG: glycerol-3-phosphate dehydrogenase [Alphaproteobacteria bacterium]|nr:glycerol-3-phosphate dehydrogenase [Alphaproteobacteria bacterium]